ncbi:MAG: flavin reductase family protein [Candidatus Kapabacteria bacterium]|nr:flavin reductase family protein [Candidatus Kapabacteria bacterium]
MFEFEVKDLSINKISALLTYGVSPRPIALVSTISQDGVNNLSPFSFFNAFGSNPPVVAFSPSRRVRDGSLKDTYHNLIESKECVIHAVSYAMVEQVNLASCDYPPEVDEFIKSGFTPIESDLVKPRRVMESPFQMECKLIQMVNCGDEFGAGNIAICEVLKFHISEKVYRDGKIDPALLDLVGRNGAEYYTHANKSSLFTVMKPGTKKGMGFDNLPDFIKDSSIYTANNLGKMALLEKLPTQEELDDFIKTIESLNELEFVEATEANFVRFSDTRDYRQMFAIAYVLHLKNNPKVGKYIELAAKAAIDVNDFDFGIKAAVWRGKFIESRRIGN